MRATDRKPLYRHIDVALLRAAAAPLTDALDRWPNLTDTDACRCWLEEMWSRPDLADAVRQASPSLGEGVDAIRAGRTVGNKQIRSATLSTARYLLRSIGRPTPFGLFAGVAPVTLARTAQADWGKDHRGVARVNTGWLADIITRAQRCPELLERLDVVVTDLAVRRGSRLEVPQGPNRVTIRYTRAVAAVHDMAATPVRFGTLIDTLAEDFTADRSRVRDMLTELVRQGYLLTSLRAPFTVTDPFAYLMERLHGAEAEGLPAIASLVRDLDTILADLRRHNHETTMRAEQSRVRATITRRMRELSPEGRTPLAVDLLLDCAVRLPHQVAQEMERAASALLRLTRQPTGDATWRDYHSAFVDKYGTGTVVPLTEALDPDAGLGYPAGYRGSVLPMPAPGIAERAERLLALAWQAMADGTREIVLTDDLVGKLTGETFDERYIPPHVELSARIRAASADALDRGEFTLTVAHARSAGTLTSRFTPTATGSGLAQAYRVLPAATEGALRVQMSFGPLYPHAENVCRVPAYLLSPAQWRLARDDLPPGQAGPDQCRQVLDRWRHRWGCLDVVELRDADRTLRLTLDEPAHATLLHAHLKRHGQAILYAATSAAEFGWIDGHTHEIALPLVTTRAPAPNPLRGCLPEMTNTHGHLPGSLDATWLSVKIYTHPERMNEIITEHLPTLLGPLDTGPSSWWLRYRSHQETDHLRLRVRTDRDHYATCTNAVGEWTQRMRQTGMVGRLAIDTYYPEIGRYGHGEAMDAAEKVFAADSHLVATALRELPATAAHPTALAAANMVGIVHGFLGGLADAMEWLVARTVPSTPATDRAVTDQAIRLATDMGALREVPGWAAAVDRVWQARADALAAYRKQLPPDADLDSVLESLLHMHHNRAIGIDPDGERTCRRLARQAALSWQARQAGEAR
ncbi:MAG: lantibiotic dehydratase [Pseudonocardiaceae bacterium]